MKSAAKYPGLLRRFAPRNDGYEYPARTVPAIRTVPPSRDHIADINKTPDQTR